MEAIELAGGRTYAPGTRGRLTQHRPPSQWSEEGADWIQHFVEKCRPKEVL
jgi:hypothetical protein